jgi:hypothetical protein
MPDASATTRPGAGSWHDADRSVTARRSLLSWSQTVAEPGHGRARGAAWTLAAASVVGDDCAQMGTFCTRRVWIGCACCLALAVGRVASHRCEPAG